jgi:hypothetical protein
LSRLTFVLGLVAAAAFLSVTVSVAASWAETAAPATTRLSASISVAHSDAFAGTDAAPTSDDSDAPLGDGEQPPDPTESSRGGEEPPESSDAETIFVDRRATFAPAALPVPAARKGSPPPVLARALESQFHPAGLERPPRA